MLRQSYHSIKTLALSNSLPRSVFLEARIYDTTPCDVRIIGSWKAIHSEHVGNSVSDLLHLHIYIQGVPSARGLSWIDLHFECFTVCLILSGLTGIWQMRLGKMVEHPNQTKSNSGARPDGTPCSYTIREFFTKNITLKETTRRRCRRSFRCRSRDRSRRPWGTGTQCSVEISCTRWQFWSDTSFDWLELMSCVLVISSQHKPVSDQNCHFVCKL